MSDTHHVPVITQMNIQNTLNIPGCHTVRCENARGHPGMGKKKKKWQDEADHFLHEKFWLCRVIQHRRKGVLEKKAQYSMLHYRPTRRTSICVPLPPNAFPDTHLHILSCFYTSQCAQHICPSLIENVKLRIWNAGASVQSRVKQSSMK